MSQLSDWPSSVTSIGETSVHGQIEMAKAADDAGADWLILQPPPIKNVPESELVEFLGRVADAATLPVAIQNNPMNLDVWLSNSGLKSLNRNHPNVTLLKGDLTGIVRARRLSRATMRNIRQNLFFAFVYNALGVPVAAGVLYPIFGILLSPIIAAAAMALSSVSVIGNAIRLRTVQL